MRIAVTGASGKLGNLVVEKLLETLPADRVVAVARDPARVAGLAARGVEVRRADYSKPETLGAALSGTERVLFVSGSEVGRRVPQHEAVVEAAKRTGVKLLAYTSVLHGERSPLALAAEHIATERAIRASGVPFVLLRNGWYLENYTENLAPALAHGAIVGCSGDGRIAAAARRDYADAAAAVLVGSGHENRVYELAGDRPFTKAELAAEVSRRAGRPVVYRDLPPDEYRAVLVAAGVPAPFADLLVDTDLNIARGALDDTSGDLSRLIGRPTLPLADAVAAALR